MKCAFISLWLLCGFVPRGKKVAGYFATNTTVLIPDSKVLYPYAFGPVKARVSSSQALSLELGIAAGTGYAAGNVTATTDRSGRVVRLVKQKQACAITYNASTGSVQGVKCTGARRLSAETDPTPEDENVGIEVAPETNRLGSDDTELQVHRRLGSQPCPACATLVFSTFSSKIKSICGTPFFGLVPSQYAWAKRVSAALCTIASKKKNSIDLAYKVCRCCIENSDCPSGVCSDGVCLSRKLARGEPCPDFDDDDCENGTCALGSYPTGSYICCPSNMYILRLNNVTKTYHCALTQKAGALCNEHRLCASGACSNGRCLAQKLSVGASCNDNALCASNVCVYGICYSQKLANRQRCPDGEDADCMSSQCGRASSPRGDFTCCDSEKTYRDGLAYCINQEIGSPCFADEFCTSGVCVGGVCVSRSTLATEDPTHLDTWLPTDFPSMF